MQAGAGQQVRPGFPGAGVESQARQLRGPVGGAHLELPVVPADQVHHAGVRHHDALGLAGGAGGVDDIGQMRRVQAQRLRRQVRVRLFGDLAPVPIQRNHLSFRGWQVFLKVLLRQQHLGRCIAQHVGQPVFRVGRIQRYVGAARFQDAHQTHYHFQAALHADRDQDIRSYVQTTQMVRQLIGFDVELGVGQRLISEHHRHGIRLPGGLGFKWLMQQLLLRIIGPGGVPVVKHLAALGLRQHADPAHGGIRCAFQGRDQIVQRRVHHRAQPFRRRRRQGLRRQRKLFAQVVHG